jgi:hypothetical protein
MTCLKFARIKWFQRKAEFRFGLLLAPTVYHGKLESGQLMWSLRVGSHNGCSPVLVRDGSFQL